jgi:membrane fusion protein, heavy metal efflux system
VDNNKLIEVFPIVGGNVQHVYAALGDYVKKGQVLATIRSTEVAGFEKDLKDAQNDVVVASNNLRVAQELFAGKLSAEKDVLETKSHLDKAESQLSRVKETYNIYNMKPGAIYQIVAPISGFVIEKKINQDMQLRSDRSDNVFDIAEINEISAIANVNESDISEIGLGMDAFVSVLSYPDHMYRGKVDKIYTIIDPTTKAMKVGIKLKNMDFLLKPEMRATIRITHTDREQMLTIPTQAVIFDKSKYYVMIFKDRSHIDTRQVEIFRQVGDITYIRSGLKEGEQIIIKGQLLIYDALND